MKSTLPRYQIPHKMDSDQGRPKMVPMVRVLEFEKYITNIFFKSKLIYHCTIFRGKFNETKLSLQMVFEQRKHYMFVGRANFPQNIVLQYCYLLIDTTQYCLWQMALLNCGKQLLDIVAITIIVSRSGRDIGIKSDQYAPRYSTPPLIGVFKKHNFCI